MEKNSYTVEEAARIMGCPQQAIREQVKAGKILGCSCIKKGKNWAYYIPKLALDNHLRGANAIDVTAIKQVVKEAVKETIQDLINTEVERRLNEKVSNCIS